MVPHLWQRNWQFDAAGLMELHFASINEHQITEMERKFRWPLGCRPEDHPSLSNLGLEPSASHRLSTKSSKLSLI
jgi:nuclear transport factor 2 (NTF2) superfamily protein